MSKRMKFAEVVAVVVGVSLFGSAVEAQRESESNSATEQVEHLNAEGAKHYRAERYRDALSAFRGAYKLYPSPNLLYNIGRVHEALGEFEDAESAYERCVQDERTRRTARENARKRLAIVQRILKSRQSAVQIAAQQAARVAADEATARAAAAPRTSETDEPPVNWMGIFKWVTGGIGLAAVIGGSVSFALGAGDHSKLDDANQTPSDQAADLTRQEALDLRDGGSTKKTVGYVLWGVGGAALAASAVLFALDWGGDEKKEAEAGGAGKAWRAVRFSVVPAQGGTAFLLNGRF